MFAIQNNKIYQVKIVTKTDEHDNTVNKENKSGTGVWCDIINDKDGLKKRKIISYSNLFSTKEEAEIVLTGKQNFKQIKEAELNEELKQVDNIINRIYSSFGVTIKYLSRPVTIEDAWKLYYKIRDNQELRNMELY